MNTHNNKRKRESQEKIEKTFIQLIQTKEINQISVTDICKLSHINRSTFYANYIDIFDLVNKIEEKMMSEFFDLYSDERQTRTHSYNFLKLFTHIKENQLFYKTYFKLNLDSNYNIFRIDDAEVAKYCATPDFLDYHIEFFKAGLNAIIKKWLYNGCKETPEEINSIIKNEYLGRGT